MATATAEKQGLPGTAGDGHKRKKNALSDGQGRLAWILLAPTLLVIIVVAGIPVAMSIRESFYQTNAGVDPNDRPGRRRGVASSDCRTTPTSSPARTRSSAPTARWTGSGTRS